jgi:hypothetical protein
MESVKLVDMAGDDITTAGDRRRRRFRSSPDDLVSTLKQGLDGEAIGGGDATIWSPWLSLASLVAAVSFGQAFKSGYG